MGMPGTGKDRHMSATADLHVELTAALGRIADAHGVDVDDLIAWTEGDTTAGLPTVHPAVIETARDIAARCMRKAKGDLQRRHFTAVYPNAEQAAGFEANATRTTGAVNVVRSGRTVEFDANTISSDGDVITGDIALSVGHYGGPGTMLNGLIVPREM